MHLIFHNSAQGMAWIPACAGMTGNIIMRKFLLPTLALILLSASAHAAKDFTLPSKALNAELTGTYTLDKSHANIIFTVSHLGFSGYMGRFDDFDATLTFDGKDVTKSALEVTINTASRTRPILQSRDCL